MNELDPLSDVLRSVRLRGSVFFHVSCRDQWAAQAPHSSELAPAVMPGAEHVIEYHLFVKGEGWVAVDGEPPLRLKEGRHHHAAPRRRARGVQRARPGAGDNGGDWLFRMRDDPKPIPITYRGGMFEAGLGLPPEDATTSSLCGFIACDLKPFNPLINALPRLLHLPADGVGAWVAPMLEQAASESGERAPAVRRCCSASARWCLSTAHGATWTRCRPRRKAGWVHCATARSAAPSR
jgi:hypothetical protein